MLLFEKLSFITNLNSLELACLATVSNQVIARKIEQEGKKWKIEGRGRGGEGRGGEGRGKEETFPSILSPLPLEIPLLCSRPKFLVKLAQKRFLYRPVWHLHMMSSSLQVVFLGIFFHRMLGSVNLTTVEVKGVAAALDKHTPKGESKGVKAYFRMDENGILNLEKVGYCVSSRVLLGELLKYRMGYSFPSL